MRAEILIDPDMHLRGKRMIKALIDTAPIPVIVSARYTGTCDLLLTYGTGHPLRRPWWASHRKSGRHCFGWDLGYWGDHMRCTIDTDHPQDWIRPEDPDRFDRQGIKLRDDFGPKGPAIVVGMGKKSLPVFGLRVNEWEAQAANRARSMGLVPYHKPKRAKYPKLANAIRIETDKIESALRGAALVLCRHSNVAVDACIAGVPVICEDGAAYALYKHGTSPTIEQRREFLRSLAHWQYKPEEAGLAWKYLLSRLP